MNNERVNNSFWATLNSQVAGIRETLEDLPDDESDEHHQGLLPSAANDTSSQHFDMILFGASCCIVNPPEPLPTSTVTALLDIYIYRVDSIFKISHMPALRNLLLSEERGHSDSLDCHAREALKFSVCFTAICSLSEVEVQKMFMEKKNGILNRFRLSTEVMLSRAGLLTTSDLTVLQAFVIYLAGRRTCPGYKKIWTLVATAVSIGQSLGLDSDERRVRTPFEMEVRRRVWYSIGVLDMQAAFDGGSHSVIANNGVLGRPPLNIDDAVLSLASSQSPLNEQPGLTDMSYSCMMHDGLICMRKLTHAPTDAEGWRVEIRQEWANRSKIVKDWEQRIYDRYLQHCDSTQTFQQFMKFVGQDMIVTMRLLERRPMHRLFSAGPPPADEFNVLELATDVVERSFLKFTNPAFAPWSWFAWVKWYILAIMLAELCGHGDGPLIERAWKVAEEAFTMFPDLVIDDMRWRSVERLMRKARSTKGAPRGSSRPIPAPTCPQATSSHGSMRDDWTNKEDHQLQSDEMNCHGGTHRDHGQTPQSIQNSVPLIETDQSGAQLPPVGVESSAPDAFTDSSEYMSWVNWEIFVQEVGDLNEKNALEASYWGSYATS